MGSLTDKVAIVTGASSGIGRAIAERLAQEGATVVVNYAKSADKAKAVVTGIQSRGGKAVVMHADMTNVSDARRLVKDTVDRLGRLDILVNNAGMAILKPLSETTEQEFDQIFARVSRSTPYRQDSRKRRCCPIHSAIWLPRCPHSNE
jgi:3-oxoacyl-[acyl-carrier protein] reductase